MRCDLAHYSDSILNKIFRYKPMVWVFNTNAIVCGYGSKRGQPSKGIGYPIACYGNHHKDCWHAVYSTHVMWWSYVVIPVGSQYNKFKGKKRPSGYYKNC